MNPRINKVAYKKHPKSTCIVTFVLPASHRDTNGRLWRRTRVRQINERKPYKVSHMTVKPQMNKQKIACIAKADTGASTHYWRPQDRRCLMDIHKETGPRITLPDGSALRSTEVGYLPISTHISAKGRKARIVPQLQSSSLISVGQLADDGCETHINDRKLIITKDKKHILTGYRNYED